MTEEVFSEPVEFAKNTDFEQLTEKEAEILQLIKEGKSNTEVCKKLSITANTVNFHMKNILQKLGVFNRTHAASLAFRRDIEKSRLQQRETCHRIKNHFNILYALVTLRAQSHADNQCKETLNWLGTQIRSISSIHNLLSQLSPSEAIPIRGLCDDLVRHVQTLLPNGKIQFKTDVDDLLLNRAVVLPCLQIIIELVLNSLKHAFPSNSKGCIQISLKTLGRGTKTRLIVSDDGVGLPAQLRAPPGSLGMKIVPALVQQIGGSLKVNRTRGTEFAIDFPNKKIGT